MEQLRMQSLGIPTTIGELRKLIEKYDDSISFGFRNQLLQELMDVDNGNCIVFNETAEGCQLRLFDNRDCTKGAKKALAGIIKTINSIDKKRIEQIGYAEMQKPFCYQKQKAMVKERDKLSRYVKELRDYLNKLK